MCRYNAPLYGLPKVDGEEIDLLVGDSHTMYMNKEQKKYIRHARSYHHTRLSSCIKTVSFLCYPGFSITNNKHWKLIEEDLTKVKDKYNVKNVYVNFGTNDASRASSLLFPDDESLDHLLINGNDKLAASTDIIDPLSIISLYTKPMVEEYEQLSKCFVKRVEEIADSLNLQHITVLAHMGRFLKGVSSHLAYNRAAYYLRNQLHVRANSDMVKKVKVHLIDIFQQMWCDGTMNLLCLHKDKERKHVILQQLHYTEHGAVHYSTTVYYKLMSAILDIRSQYNIYKTCSITKKN